MDWFTRACNTDTGDGVVEPAIVGGVVRPAAVGVVLTVDGVEVCPDVLALGTALETGVVVIFDRTLDRRIGTDRATCLANSTELIW